MDSRLLPVFDSTDVPRWSRSRGLDTGTVVFDLVQPRWSVVMTDAEGMMVEVAEMRQISRNAAGAVEGHHLHPLATGNALIISGRAR